MQESSASLAVAIAVTFTGMEEILMIPSTEVGIDPDTVPLNTTSESFVKLGLLAVPPLAFKFALKLLLATCVQLVVLSLAPAISAASSAACMAVRKLLARE